MSLNSGGRTPNPSQGSRPTQISTTPLKKVAPQPTPVLPRRGIPMATAARAAERNPRDQGQRFETKGHPNKGHLDKGHLDKGHHDKTRTVFLFGTGRRSRRSMSANQNGDRDPHATPTSRSATSSRSPSLQRRLGSLMSKSANNTMNPRYLKDNPNTYSRRPLFSLTRSHEEKKTFRSPSADDSSSRTNCHSSEDEENCSQANVKVGQMPLV